MEKKQHCKFSISRENKNTISRAERYNAGKVWKVDTEKPTFKNKKISNSMLIVLI